MRFTNFAGGCVGKVFTAILCILIGVVLTLGGIVGGVAILLTRKGMVGTVENVANNNNIKIEFDEQLRGLSLLDWSKQLRPILSDFTNTNIEDLEKAIGIDFLSKNIHNMTGLPLDVVKQSKLSDFGKTFAEHMTVANASEKFGIEFPDLPVFQQPHFLNSPLSTAFAQMDNFELQDFITINEQSSPILQELKNLKIGEMSDPEKGLDNRINSLELHKVITIVEEGENKSSAILIKLKDTKVGELGSPETNDLIMSMELQEVIEIVEGVSTPVLWELRSTPIGQLGSSETDDRIKNMKIADLMTIDSNSSKILQYFAANDVTLAGKDEFDKPNGIDQAIKVMRLKDMMTLTDPSEPGGSTKFMWALRDCPIETIPADGDDPEILGIEAKLKITPLNELLETSNSHIWQYLGVATILTIGAAVDDMRVADAIEITESSPAILRKMRVAVGEEDPAMFGSEDLKINEMNTKLEPLILDLELGEILTIVEPAPGNPDDPNASEPILIALKGEKLSNMNNAMKDITVAQVFRESAYNNGILSLVDPDTKITNISSVITTAVADARLQKLINSGAIDEDNLAVNSYELQAGMRNKSIGELLLDYTGLLSGNPQTSVLPRRHYLDASHGTVLSSSLILGLPNFAEGDTIVLFQDMTLASEDFTFIFNVMTNAKNLTIHPEGATIRSFDGANDKGGYMFLSDQPYSPNLYGGQVYGGGNVIDLHLLTPPEGIKAVDIIEIKVD